MLDVREGFILTSDIMIIIFWLMCAQYAILFTEYLGVYVLDCCGELISLLPG